MSTTATRKSPALAAKRRGEHEALAQFFGVPPAYFFDDEQSVKVAEELALLGALRDAGVRDVACVR